MIAWLNQVTDYLRNNAGLLASRIVVAIIIVASFQLLGRLASVAVLKLLSRGAAQKLGPMVASLTRTVLLLVGLLTALDHVGINVATLLAGAGVVGLAVGFGSQALVKDTISGFFLILDGALMVGDIAQVGPATGEVESVGLRVTKVRADNGQLWYIPNGQVSIVGNFSRGWTRSEVCHCLAKEQDLPVAMKTVQQVADAFAKEHGALLLEAPDVHAVPDHDKAPVCVHVAIKTKSAKPAEIEKDLQKRIRTALRSAQVETVGNA